MRFLVVRRLADPTSNISLQTRHDSIYHSVRFLQIKSLYGYLRELDKQKRCIKTQNKPQNVYIKQDLFNLNEIFAAMRHAEAMRFKIKFW